MQSRTKLDGNSVCVDVESNSSAVGRWRRGVTHWSWSTSVSQTSRSKASLETRKSGSANDNTMNAGAHRPQLEVLEVMVRRVRGL